MGFDLPPLTLGLVSPNSDGTDVSVDGLDEGLGDETLRSFVEPWWDAGILGVSCRGEVTVGLMMAARRGVGLMLEMQRWWSQNHFR